VKHSPGETFDRCSKVIIVIVGSDFTDITTWQNQGATAFSDFKCFPFFGDNSDYVAFYVNELRHLFCEVSCDGSSFYRHFCCTTSVAKSIALSCYADIAYFQVLAIHNTARYGGGEGEVATTTAHPYSSLVAVHEIALRLTR